MKKVILILVDGMRPDAIKDFPYVKELMKKSSYTMNAQTVYPSGTLTAHISMFNSVSPKVHGIFDNNFQPLKTDVPDVCEFLNQKDIRSAMFYNWETLKHLTKPEKGSVAYSCYFLGYGMGYGRDTKLTDTALGVINDPDFDYLQFAFLYLGWTDVMGHSKGWMSDEYNECIKNAWDNIEKVINTLGDDYTYIITADHGGHDKSHGSELPEDMTIPLFLLGKDFEPGKEIEKANIMDIAPTITKLLGVETHNEWEGKSLL